MPPGVCCFTVIRFILGLFLLVPRGWLVGVVRGFVYRLLSGLVVVLVSVVTGLIIVHRLGVIDYSVYQVVSRRGVVFASVFPGVVGGWGFRLGSENRLSRDVLIGGLVYSFVTGFVVGLLLSIFIGIGSIFMVLIGFFLGFYSGYRWVYSVVSGSRPVMVSLLGLIQRSVYVIGVLSLLYLVYTGLTGVLLSGTVSFLSSILVGLYLLRNRVGEGRNILKYIRKSYIFIPSYLSSIVLGLDALIAYKLVGPVYVAGFFASLLPVAFIREPVSMSSSYVSSLLLGGRRVNPPDLLLVTYLLSIPLIGLIITHPLHVVYLVNPSYRWTVPVLIGHSVSTMFILFEMFVHSDACGRIRGEGEGVEKEIIRLNTYILLSRVIYILYVSMTFLVVKDPVYSTILWSLGGITYTATSVTLMKKYVNLRSYLKTIISSITVLIVVTTEGLLIHFPPPSTHFVEELKEILYPVGEYLLISYTTALSPLVIKKRFYDRQ